MQLLFSFLQCDDWRVWELNTWSRMNDWLDHRKFDASQTNPEVWCRRVDWSSSLALDACHRIPETENLGDFCATSAEQYLPHTEALWLAFQVCDAQSRHGRTGITARLPAVTARLWRCVQWGGLSIWRQCKWVSWLQMRLGKQQRQHTWELGWYRALPGLPRPTWGLLEA